MSAKTKTLLCVGGWVLEEAPETPGVKTERFGVLWKGECIGAFYELDYAFGFFRERAMKSALSLGMSKTAVTKMEVFRVLHGITVPEMEAY